VEKHCFIIGDCDERTARWVRDPPGNPPPHGNEAAVRRVVGMRQLASLLPTRGPGLDLICLWLRRASIEAEQELGATRAGVQ
jgi:hypothetical protein